MLWSPVHTHSSLLSSSQKADSPMPSTGAPLASAVTSVSAKR